MATISFTEDGIIYLLDDTTYTAAVTGRENATITNIIIKETLQYNGDTYTVTSISNNAFLDSDIVSLTMPDTIESIGWFAFRNCLDLSGSLTLPANLNRIDAWAFHNCKELTGELIIPAHVILSDGIFQGCEGFTSIIIEDGVTKIPAQMCMGCTGLTGDLVIPDSVVSIGTSAFNGCTGLNGTLTIGENVEIIQGLAFANCNFTGKITIPHSVTSLYSYIFEQTSPGFVEQDSFKKLIDIHLDLNELLGLPDTDSLSQQLEEQYEDTVSNSTDNTVIYKSANTDEIEINYAQAQTDGYDILFVIDTSDSMQKVAEVMLDSVINSYPRMVYTVQIADELSARLLNTDYDNRVAIATFSSSALWNTGDFLDDYNALQSLIWANYTWFGKQTNYSSGLSSAIDLVNNRVDSSRRAVVIFLSDGKPNEGSVDGDGVYGGTQAQTLREMGVPVYPVSIFLSDADLIEARAALTAISFDKNTYFEARDVETFQTIITDIVGYAIAKMTDTRIVDELSQYFELATGTAADLSTDCGTAYIDGDGKIVWDLSNCSLGQIHTLHIKIKVIDDAIPRSDYYPTNETLDIEDPYDTELPESPEVYIRLDLVSSKEVTDASGTGKAAPGEELTYTIKATNNSDVTFNDLLIQDTLTGVLPYVEDTSAVTVTVNVGGTVTTKTIQDLVTGFTVNLGIGETVTVTFKVTVINTLDTQTVTEIANKATVGDTTPEAEIPTDPMIGEGEPIDPVKQVSEGSEAGTGGSMVQPWDSITYEISYTNYNDEAAEVVIIDRLSAGVDFVSATDGGLYDKDTHTVTWTLTNVESDTEGTVSVVVLVNENAGVRIENSATVQVGENEPLITNVVTNPVKRKGCLSQTAKCRKAITGHKIWVDDDNANDTRPPFVEIVLRRDGEVYQSVRIGSTGNGTFTFGCLLIWRNSEQKYNYQIDETDVPGYTKTIEGYIVTNTLTP